MARVLLQEEASAGINTQMLLQVCRQGGSQQGLGRASLGCSGAGGWKSEMSHQQIVISDLHLYLKFIL